MSTPDATPSRTRTEVHTAVAAIGTIFALDAMEGIFPDARRQIWVIPIAFAAIYNLYLLIRRVQLGPVLARAPHSSRLLLLCWLLPLALPLAAVTLPSSTSLVIGALSMFASLTLFLLVRNDLVCRDGILVRAQSFPWSNIRSAAWDRGRLRLTLADRNVTISIPAAQQPAVNAALSQRLTFPSSNPLQ